MSDEKSPYPTWIYKAAFDDNGSETTLAAAKREIESLLGAGSVEGETQIEMEIEDQEQQPAPRSSTYNVLKLTEAAFDIWLLSLNQLGWQELGFEPYESKAKRPRPLIGRIPVIVYDDEAHDEEMTGTRVWIRTRRRTDKVYDWYYD